ncbi:MAG: amino acid ABC transporter substrate-binding protein [Ardenticatenaceae bacterium]|nr:amino acid ABC transporter substrate-binding protein [Ardenticatenaceae bacterium]MCB8986312.1 amino acid ABC transporter substrate-binding protein [Ardenticatenaceae bacterium]
MSSLLFLLLLTGLAACNGRESAWPRIQQEGVLRVGLDPTYPPFEVDTGGELSGLDVDLAQAMGADLGLDVAFSYFGYDGLYDALATEQVDVLLSALVIDPARREDFAYSEPYFNAGQILIVRQGETAVTSMTDLANRTLAVELGAQSHVEALEWSRKLAGLTVQPYTTPEEALTAVLQGEADAALVDGINGRLFLRDNPGLTYTANPVTVEPYALVVRIEDSELLDHLNDSLARLQSSGELDAIIAKWLGE